MAGAPVVVGVDGSAASRRALGWAAEYGRMTGVPVEALIAWEIPASYGIPASYDDVDFAQQARETLDDAIRDVCGAQSPVRGRVERGHPAVLLVAASEEAQLLVVGSRGHGAFTGMLLGSVSAHCLQHAHCPVVVFRGRDDD
jgi:nucleotide-binding universal stress UspA family protein